MTSTTANSTQSNDTNDTDEIRIDIDSTETESEQTDMHTALHLMSTDTIFLDNVDATTQLPQSLHPQDEIGRHGRAQPEPPDDHHTNFMAEILRHQNNMPNVSKIVLEMTEGIASLLQLAYPSPGSSTSPGLLPNAVSITLRIATIVLRIGIILREWNPGAAKVTEKIGVLVFACSILLLICLFIASKLRV